jgi:hypothetical protein
MSVRKSDAIGELTKALTVFQKGAPKITKDQIAKVPTKSGSEYTYKYADLSDIWDKIRGPLADNGLAVIQMPTTMQNEPALTTVLAHESGEWVEDTMKLPIMQETPQGHGSAITYARRYSLCSVLGIVADSDNDAQDHRPLSPIQKQQLFVTAKKIMPELGDDPLSMVRFITEMVGKHPTRILADEFDDALASVEGYTAKEVVEA